MIFVTFYLKKYKSFLFDEGKKKKTTTLSVGFKKHVAYPISLSYGIFSTLPLHPHPFHNHNAASSFLFSFQGTEYNSIYSLVHISCFLEDDPVSLVFRITALIVFFFFFFRLTGKYTNFKGEPTCISFHKTLPL